MYNKNNQSFNYQNHPNQPSYGAPQYNHQQNYGQPNSNHAHFPIENSSPQQYQTKTQSSNGKSQQSQSLGFNSNYTTFNKYNSKIKLISKGKGINEKEYDIIVSTCIKIQDSKASPPLSIKWINKIKEKIGGEWLVFVRRESDKNYDFYLSRKKLDKSLSFIYSGNLYDICLIRWKNLMT